MTDQELEQYVLTIDANNFCCCRRRGKVKCKAHQRLLRLAKDIQVAVLAEVTKALNGERVSGETTGAGGESDTAYNLALEHALDAIREISARVCPSAVR